MNRRAAGTSAEDEAARFLVDSGFTILDRNWRRPFGELDIVVAKPGTLVFVEVRSRKTQSFGAPIESITATKLRRLRMLASAYVQALGRHEYETTLIAIITVTYAAGIASCALTWVD